MKGGSAVVQVNVIYIILSYLTLFANQAALDDISQRAIYMPECRTVHHFQTCLHHCTIYHLQGSFSHEFGTVLYIEPMYTLNPQPTETVSQSMGQFNTCLYFEPIYVDHESTAPYMQLAGDRMHVKIIPPFSNNYVNQCCNMYFRFQMISVTHVCVCVCVCVCVHRV